MATWKETLQLYPSIGLEHYCCLDPLQLLVLTQNAIHLHYIFFSSLLGCIYFINQACIFPQTEDLMGLWEFWEETDLEAEPTWPSWLGNDSKLWSFFTASCGDKHKWLSSYCFNWSNTSFANVDKIICSVEQSGLRVMRGYCSLNTLWLVMIEAFTCKTWLMFILLYHTFF